MNLDSDEVAGWLSELDHVWRIVSRLTDAELAKSDYAAKAGIGKECRKGHRSIMTRGALGPTARLIILQCFLAESGQRLFANAMVASGLLAPETVEPEEFKRVQKKQDVYRKASNITEKYDCQQFPKHLKAGLLKLVNNKRRHLGLDEIDDPKLVYDRKFSGDRAVYDMFEFLGVPMSRRQPLIQPRRFFINEGRQEFVQQLREKLSPSATQGGAPAVSPMLFNIHGAGLGAGLKAFASWLALEELKLDRRPVLVIPLTRVVVQKEHGRVVSRNVRILNYPEIVGILHTFVTKGIYAVETAEPIHDTEVLGLVIDDIRAALARQPSILIFEGYSVHPERSYLERMVADDHLSGLIAALMDPPISRPGPALDLHYYARNKIVVTSNLPANFSGLPQNPAVYGETAVLPLDPPKLAPRREADAPNEPASTTARLEEFLAQQTLMYPAETGEILDSLDSSAPMVDIAEIIDAFIRMGSRGQEDTVPTVDKIIHALANLKVSKPEDLTRELLERLYPTIPRLWQQILQLVSLAPDGLRPATVKRFARRASLMPPEIRPFGLLANCETDEPERPISDLLAEIDVICDATQALFGRYRNDTVENFDGVLHPLEFGLNSFARLTGSEALGTSSLDFLHPEVKLFFRQKAMASLPGDHFHAAARLLAEDALMQMTIGLRHIDTRAFQSIRSWRRMFSAFFHGLQSIPVKFRTGETLASEARTAFADRDLSGVTLARFEDVDFGIRDLVTISKPIDLWKYLYAFGLRTMVEEAPKWHLARSYGLDEFKLDLLTCFDQPWRLRPGLSQHERERPESIFLDNVDDPGIAKLADEFVLSNVQSRIAVGKFGDGEPAAHREGGLMAISRGRRSAKHLKRAMDIGLLRGENYDVEVVDTWLSQQLGELMAVVGEYEREALSAIQNLLVDGRSFAPDAKLPSAKDVASAIFAHGASAQWGSERYADLCDIFARIGESHAVRGDLALAFQKISKKTGKSPKRLREARTARLSSTRSITSGPHGKDEPHVSFAKALVFFSIAEDVRLLNFATFPLDRHFNASGHPMRQSIRVALKLEVQARSLYKPEDGQPLNKLGVFAGFARRRSDTLTRFLHPFPRERASLLVLEASMLRLLTLDENRQENLRTARHFIAAAERLTIGLGETARIKLHIALERAKLSRAMAGVSVKDLQDNNWRRYLAHCHYDVEFIKRVADRMNLAVWSDLAEFQGLHLAEEKAQLEKLRSQLVAA